MQLNFMKFPSIYADLRLNNFSQISPSAARQLVLSVKNSLRGTVKVESIMSLRHSRVSVFVQSPVVYNKTMRCDVPFPRVSLGQIKKHT